MRLRRHEDELQALGAGDRRELDFEPVQQIVDAEIGEFGLHGAGVEPRNVEQRGENLLDRFERRVDVRHQIGVFAGALALDQARHIKPRRIERLQNVVARRGDEARLRHIGFVGLGLGAFELGIEPRQFAGALAHAALQRRIGAFQRFGGFHARRDIGEGRDQAAMRHAIGAHFDDQTAIGEAFEERLVFRRVMGDALGDEFVGILAVALGILGDVAQDFGERGADAGEAVRQIEDLAELAVPAHQRLFLVEHRDALAHVVERGLQDLAVVMDRGIGVVEQFQRRLGRDVALAQQQRQHEPRRRRADRGGEQIFAILQQLEIGFGLRIEVDAAGDGKARERFAGALFAEIAGDRRDQFLDGDRGAAQPEARRHRLERGGHEQIRLHLFDGGRTAQQRAADIERDVEARDSSARRCTSGGRSAPNSACGRSNAKPHGPSRRMLTPTMPASEMLGSSSV